jgi:hypothetical protein
VLYELNPVLSDAFITTIYALMLGFLGCYAMFDFLKARRTTAHGEAAIGGHGGGGEGAELGGLPKKLQAVVIPPMVKFDFDFTPGGRSISWVFLVLSGGLVGLAAGIMGVGGGFLTFPIFVYMLGVSSMTTVGTDIFQIVFTAGYASISQYAIYGFIFYTLAMGCCWAHCWASRSAPWSPRWCPASPSAAFTPWPCWRVCEPVSLPCRPKLGEMGVIRISKGMGATLETIGVWAFFIVIAGFGIWVIGTFVKNIGQLRGEGEHA